MSLKNLSDEVLLIKIKNAAGEERNKMAEVLRYLREVDTRKLYLARGYSSLNVFCIEFLGYDESQAFRRIAACRLIKELPEIETKVEEGVLSLTTLTQAQSFFRREAINEKPLTIVEKKEVLQSLEKKSKKEVERELIRLSPMAFPQKKETTTLLTEDFSQLKIVIGNETLKKLERLKNLYSHKTDGSLSELIDILATEALEKCDRVVKSHAPAKVKSVKRTRYISANIKRQVWLRDQGQCTFKDPLTQKTCASQYKLQYDHALPWAMGGEHTIENLRLRCAGHNSWHAVQTYGELKMAKYLRWIG